MIDARGVERGWITRSSYGTLAAIWGLFVAYGSLVPFAFVSIDVAEALRRFSSTLHGPLFIDSRTDFVTNILLTVPLGYFALAALRTDRDNTADMLAERHACPGRCRPRDVACITAWRQPGVLDWPRRTTPKQRSGTAGRSAQA